MFLQRHCNLTRNNGEICDIYWKVIGNNREDDNNESDDLINRFLDLIFGIGTSNRKVEPSLKELRRVFISYISIFNRNSSINSANSKSFKKKTS